MRVILLMYLHKIDPQTISWLQDLGFSICYGYVLILA